MKLFVCLLFILIGIAPHSQTLERQVVSPCGAIVNAGIEMSYTVGEAVISPLASSGIILNQGFQQPYFAVLTSSDLFPWFLLYPNPTDGNAVARFILSSPQRIKITVTNNLGQQVIHDEVSYSAGEVQYILPASRLIPGIYYISFWMEQVKTKFTKKLVRLP